MEQVNWAPEHSDALRDYLVRGMAYSEIVEAINAKFNTNYSRNAAIGRARRMGLAGPALPDVPQRIQPWLGGSSATARGGAEVAGVSLAASVVRRGQAPSNSAASKLSRGIFRLSISGRKIVDIRLAATSKESRSRSVGTRASRARAIARRIST